MRAIILVVFIAGLLITGREPHKAEHHGRKKVIKSCWNYKQGQAPERIIKE